MGKKVGIHSTCYYKETVAMARETSQILGKGDVEFYDQGLVNDVVVKKSIFNAANFIGIDS